MVLLIRSEKYDELEMRDPWEVRLITKVPNSLHYLTRGKMLFVLSTRLIPDKLLISSIDS